MMANGGPIPPRPVLARGALPVAWLGPQGLVPSTTAVLLLVLRVAVLATTLALLELAPFPPNPLSLRWAVQATMV